MQICEVEDIKIVNNVYRKDDPRPVLDCFVNGQKLPTLYDTGAMLSLLKQSAWTDQFEKNIPMLQRLNFKLQNASGQPMQIVNVLTLTIRAFKKEIKHTFYVVKDLNVPALMGIPLINKLLIGYCPISKKCYEASHCTARIHNKQTMLPRSVNILNIKVSNNDNELLKNTDLLLHMQGNNFMKGNNALIHTNEHGIAAIEICNHSEQNVQLERNFEIGEIEALPDMENFDINECKVDFCPKPPLKSKANESQKQFILDNAKLDHLSMHDKTSYLDLLYLNYDVISFNEHDLGRSNVLSHSIPLFDSKPVYINQYPVPLAHVEPLKNYVKSSEGSGIIERTISEYNSPIMFVPKKDAKGNLTQLRPVQDFRALNAKSVPSNFRLPMISEMLQDIGWSNTKLFSQIDLRSGFHQQNLLPEHRKYTAFSVPNLGQFQWTVSAQGLRNVPANFQRLMSTVLQDMIPSKCLTYIDDILLKSSNSHSSMMLILQECFDRLRGANLKINLAKCNLATQQCTYLGYNLGPTGYQPNDKKVEVIKIAPPPQDRTGIKSFLGMVGFFREHIGNFTKYELQLTKLCRLNSTWHKGPLPPNALEAFNILKQKIAEKPILAYPQREGMYHLFVDGSQGQALEDDTGGIAGVLLQEQGPEKKKRAISYFSRPLAKHEKHYTVFLTELLSATASIEHFRTYLLGRRFVLHMDHLPAVSSLTKNQTKTLNRLQQLMLEYDFSCEYTPGPSNISDYLSRIHNIHAVELNSYLTDDKIHELQISDPVIKKVRLFLKNQTVENSAENEKLKKFALENCIIKNDLVFIRNDDKPPLLFAPSILHVDLIATAHESLIGGHTALIKTLGKIQEQFTWPGIRTDIQEYIDSCPICDKLKPKHLQTPVKALPQSQNILETVHVDLHGPLTTVDGKNFVLIAKCAFSKFAIFVALPNKEPKTVASCLFNRWVCLFGSVKFLISDGGQEFCAKISEQLYQMWQIKHKKTSAYHPQCNSSVEILNIFLAKYLKSMLETSVIEWPLLLGPLQLSYNCGVNRATKCTPFFLLFGVNPRSPWFDGNYKEKVHYGDSYAAEIHNRLMLARAIAKENNIEYRNSYETYHNRDQSKFKNFEEEDIVYLHQPELNKINRKISMPWSGPWIILKLTPQNALIQHCLTQKTRFVHRDRLRKMVNQQIAYEKFSQKNQSNEQQQQHSKLEQQKHHSLEPEIIILNPADPAPLPKQLVKAEEKGEEEEAAFSSKHIKSEDDHENIEAEQEQQQQQPQQDLSLDQGQRKDDSDDEITILEHSPPPPAKPVDIETPMPHPLTKAPLISRVKGQLKQLSPGRIAKLQTPFQSSQFLEPRLTRNQAKEKNIIVENLPLPAKPIERKSKKKL